MKLLGVIIDNRLNFSLNIRQICVKASQQVGVFKNRLKNLLPQQAKSRIFTFAILPHITYCQMVSRHFARASDLRP